jgi:acyl-coenzyme A thioesterase PaaI-like protein
MPSTLWQRDGGRISPPMQMSKEAAGSTTQQRDATQGERLRQAWQRLSGMPGGRWLFSRLIGRVAPYSGTIGARVIELEPGRAVLVLRDRRAVRNHLRSVHAIALANLGELASGLAAVTALPAGVRGIPIHISIDYLHKARGTLTATGTAALPEVTATVETDVHADIRDAASQVVATIRVRWRLERV